VKTEAARLAGCASPPPGPLEIVFSGRYQRSGYTVEKYLLPLDGHTAMPLLALAPDVAPTQAVLYLHPDGKSAEAGPGGEMETLAQQGCLVVAPDIPNSGELAGGPMPAGGDGPRRLWYGFVSLGQSTLGSQVADVLRATRFVEQRFGVPPAAVFAVARGTFGPLLLHTAAIEGVFARVALVEAPLSYRSIVLAERYELTYTTAAVPAALTAYDLPDLAACLAPKKLLLADPRDGLGTSADAETLGEDTQIVQRAYASKSAAGSVIVVRPGSRSTLRDALLAWLG
jgi:hypothetical protein